MIYLQTRNVAYPILRMQPRNVDISPYKAVLVKKALGDNQFLQVKNSLYLLRQNIYILLYVDVGILDKLLN